MEQKLWFSSDYMEGAHPEILQRLFETNLAHTVGYGLDEYSEAARQKIAAAIGREEACVRFISGGTQTNMVVISALLKPHEGVIAATTGHVNGHEAGAIEAGEHKVLALPGKGGKLDEKTVRDYVRGFYADENHEHIVHPGMVYVSQPTEYGTLYSVSELEALAAVCKDYGMRFYVDGARLAYALACPENDVTLKDLGRLTDAFYIGGTKCGALYGEALVFPAGKPAPWIDTFIKQRGAMLAKGRIAGIQFDALFTDGLYEKCGKNGIDQAAKIKEALREKGYPLFLDSPTNQIFVVMENEALKRFAERVVYGFWERPDEDHTVIRLATSWATTDEDVAALIALL